MERLKNVIQEGGEVFLVFEYLEMDLDVFLTKLENKKLEEKKVKKFMRQILSAIAFCHERSVMHRDLKPGNILVDKKGGKKILI